jgi:2',3'-cyclic-nucleotide 2'-phosphodiesterase (5'-nucleotidase family)
VVVFFFLTTVGTVILPGCSTSANAGLIEVHKNECSIDKQEPVQWTAPVVPVLILFSADSEGHVGPCVECPHHPGLGGLTRRATVLANLRNENPEMLLLDAGNFLIGSESLASRGKALVAAYNALGYDAVNLCHRDFWFGKTETLALLKETKFTALSANLLDAETSELLAKPYVVKKVGGQRIGVIGVAEAPAGMDFLPHLKEQLAGIRIQPPVEALAKWLPKAKAKSDHVILLYYGSASGLRPIREKFAGDLTAILVAGVRPEQLPPDAKPPLVATSNHGRHLARVRFDAKDGKSKLEVEQVAVEPTVKPNAEMEKVLAEYGRK